MPNKSEKRSLVVDAKKNRYGIPSAREVLQTRSSYKKSETLTCKVARPVKLYVLCHGGSQFIRDALIEKLRREAHEKARV